MSGQRTIPEYGPLASKFYDGVIRPNDYYIYYTSLKEGPYRKVEGFEAYARSIAANAEHQLSSALGADSRSDQYLNYLDNFLKILELAIKQQRDAEINYITNKTRKMQEIINKTKDTALLNELNSIKSCFESFLSSINSGGNINYLDLISAINMVELGVKNYYNILNFEEKHLNEIEKSLQNVFLTMAGGALGNVNSGDADKREQIKAKLDKFYEKFSNDLERTYLKRPTFIRKRRGATTNLENELKNEFNNNIKMHTADTYLAEIMTKLMNNLIQSDDNRRILVREYNKAKGKTTNMNLYELQKNLFQDILVFFNKNSGDILSGYYKDAFDPNSLSTSGIIEKIVDSSTPDIDFSLMGINDFFLKDETTNFFKRNTEQIIEEKNHLGGLADNVIKFFNLIKQKNFKLNEKQIKTRDILTDNGEDSSLIEIAEGISYLQETLKKIKSMQKESDEKEKFSLPFLETKSEKLLNLTGRIVTKNGRTSYILDNVPSELDWLRSSANGKHENVDFSSLIVSLKNNLNQKIAVKIKNSLNAAPTPQEQKKLVNKLRVGLTGTKLRMKVTGPNYSEIQDAVANSIQSDGKGSITIWTGPLKLKNDTIQIYYDIPLRNIEMPARIENTNIAESIQNELNTLFSEYSEKAVEVFNQTLKKEIKYVGAQNYTKSALPYKQAIEARDTVIKDLQKKIEALFKELKEKFPKYKKDIEDTKKEMLPQISEFLEDMKNTILISKTMKTYRTYLNSIGFTGSSLGADIIKQISNINDLFMAAGVAPLTKDEQGWLITACLNCSNQAILGDTQVKDNIETFLSPLAIFGMFDEAEIELSITNLAENYTNFDINIMHLYRLNSLYYPGSYILSKTYDRLLKVKSDLDTSIGDKNIRLITKINPYFKYVDDFSNLNESSPNPWKVVSKDNIGLVSLKLTFMANLLNLVKELNGSFDPTNI